MKGKKKIRRRPGTPRNMYFTKETGESIVKYCQEEDDDTRKKIYEKEILPAFVIPGLKIPPSGLRL